MSHNYLIWQSAVTQLFSLVAVCGKHTVNATYSLAVNRTLLDNMIRLEKTMKYFSPCLINVTFSPPHVIDTQQLPQLRIASMTPKVKKNTNKIRNTSEVNNYHIVTFLIVLIHNRDTTIKKRSNATLRLLSFSSALCPKCHV